MISKVHKYLQYLFYISPLRLSSEVPSIFVKNRNRSFSAGYRVALALNAPLTIITLVYFLLTRSKLIRFMSLECNLSRLKIYSTIIRLTLCKHVKPHYYFLFHFWKLENLRNSGLYLYDNKIRSCFSYINRRFNITTVHDKYVFYLFCKKNKLPTPTVYALRKEGPITWIEKPLTNEVHSIIIKPIIGSKGIGVERWDYDLNRKKYTNYLTSQEISLEHYDEYLRTKKNVMLQERIINHSLVADLSNTALATVRIISMLNESNEIELFRPMYQMPKGGALNNYLNHGAMIASVDLDRGVLSGAFNTHKTIEQFDINPMSGIVIKNRTLPFWRVLKSEVIRAHELLLPLPLLAWDVAIDDKEPKILEANINFSIDIHQKQPLTPIIPSRFFDLLNFHLEKTHLTLNN